MYNLLIIDDLGEAGVALLENNAAVEYKLFDTIAPTKLQKAIENADAIILNDQTELTAKQINSAKSLKVIGRTSVRVSNIDVEAATRKGVMVINTPHTNAVSAAEHTLALILAVARNIIPPGSIIPAGVLPLILPISTSGAI